MLTKPLYRSLLGALGILALGIRVAWAAPTIEAPASAPAGSELTFSVASPTNPRDFVTIVLKSAKDGTFATYQYLEKGGTIKLRCRRMPVTTSFACSGPAAPIPHLHVAH